MVALVIIWSYIVVLGYIYGCAFIEFLRDILQAPDEMPSVPLASLVGLVIVSVLASFYSLIANIGLVINLILAAGAIWLVFSRRVAPPAIRQPFSAIQVVLFFVAVLVILENGTHSVINPDTNIYHAQAIRWIESYPAIAGLGNLHGRLAFNSTWFVTNALFSFSFLKIESFHLAAGALFLLFLFYCWEGITKISIRSYSLSALLKIILIPTSISLLGAEISSPGTDLPANLLIWLILIIWIESLEEPRFSHPVLIVLFSCFVITIKLSAAPVLFLPFMLFCSGLNKKENLQLTLIIITGIIVIMPFILRNMVLSGYLVYPFPALDVFNFDWKVPAARVEAERETILAWGRFPRQASEQVLAMPFVQWFPAWLSNQTINRKILLLTGLFSIFPSSTGWLAGRILRQVGLAWLLMYAGTLFWLLSAPDFRFGYGFLVSTVLLASVPWIVPAISRLRLFSKPIFMVVCVCMGIFLVYTLARSVELKTLPGRIILPADYDHVPTETCDLANTSIYCAKAYNACSYEDFPCIPNPRPWVELRGRSYAEGFRSLP